MQVVRSKEPGSEDISRLTLNPSLSKQVAFWSGVVAGLALVRASSQMLNVQAGTSVERSSLNIKPGDRVVLWVNGIDTDTSKFVQTISHLFAFLNVNSPEQDPEFKVAGFHRDTLGSLDRAQAGIELFHSRRDKCPKISRAVSRDLANYIEEFVQSGASVVVVAHSAGNFLSAAAYTQMDPSVRDTVGFIGLGDPHGVHRSPCYIGIMNEDDPIKRFASPLSDPLMCPTPLPSTIDSKEHHTSRTAYLAEGSIIGGAIKLVISDMFEMLGQ